MIARVHGRPITGAEATLDGLRAVYLAEVYALLREDAVLDRLRDLLLSENDRTAGHAFLGLLGTLVPHTKPEAETAKPTLIQIVNNVARPPEAVIDVTPEAK